MKVKKIFGVNIHKEIKCPYCKTELVDIEEDNLIFEKESFPGWVDCVKNVKSSVFDGLSRLGIKKEEIDSLKDDYIKIGKKYPNLTIYPEGDVEVIHAFIKCPICGRKTLVKTVNTFDEIVLTTGHDVGKTTHMKCFVKLYGKYMQVVLIDPNDVYNIDEEYETFFNVLGFFEDDDKKYDY